MAHVACIGVGLVGSAWAVVFARAGHTVRMFDGAYGDWAVAALDRIEASLQNLEITGQDAEDIRHRITVASSLAEAVAGADWVQESVREDLTVKQEVATQIAKAAPESCIIASSTSALPGSTFLSDIPNPGRALVAHPVNPPSHIPLVELCGTGLTCNAKLDQAEDLLSAVGMEPVRVRREIDGFLLNRLQYTLVAEAMHLIGEGYCTAEDIDRVMTRGLALRWASIGPFMTAHLNSTEGFAGFVAQLGPMMKKMGRSAQTDYDWTPEMAADIHDQMALKVPINEIPIAQVRRNDAILRVSKLQERSRLP